MCDDEAVSCDNQAPRVETVDFFFTPEGDDKQNLAQKKEENDDLLELDFVFDDD